ncbi:hypothetical protein AB3S75_027440 [Citrus x aurantiifolia]
MGKLILEDRAHGNDNKEQKNHHCMDSLEEKVSVFVEDFENIRSDEDSGDDYGSENSSNNDLHGYHNERILFWEAQEALLQEIMERQSITGQKLRQEVKKIIDAVRETEFCSCPKPSSNGLCTHCLRRILVDRLCDKALNAALCTSKWKHTKQIPGGTHEYVELMAVTPGPKKQVPFLIELEFRDQFEMAKACDEYRKLVSQLPEFYIGKPEYLSAIVRVLCNAAKRSMKEKKIYMGPWRKRSFMEMKWSKSFEKGKSFDESLSTSSLPSPVKGHESCMHSSTSLAVVVT